MFNTPSPLESLAAFAISFAAGVVATAALSIYTNYMRKAAPVPVNAPD